MRSENTRSVDFELRATSGPTAVSFRLQPPGPVTIGRRSANALQLNDPAVSRDHARFLFRPAFATGEGVDGEWLVDDLGSTQSTWLNGVRLKANRQYHVRADDLIVVGPWTMLIVDRNARQKIGTTRATLDEAGAMGTVVSRFEPSAQEAMSQRGLELLLECSQRIHTAAVEAEMIDAVLDAAVKGTNFDRVAFLRPVTAGELVEVVAFRGAGFDEGAATRIISRALIREAASGSPARLQRDSGSCPTTPGQAVGGTAVALCVPIMVGSAATGFIYLDGPPSRRPLKLPGAHADGFLPGVARLAAMGMANLMRIDIERRQMRIEAELHFAAQVQRWLFPQRDGRHGPFTYVGETRQGKYIRGDFFDIIALGDHRLAVVVGDVLGKGTPVSVLVSASQGFLHASLKGRDNPVLAVTGMHDFYRSRISHARYLKLWVGLFDRRKQTLSYVVAGPGCALAVDRDGACEALEIDETPLAGTKHDRKYPVQTVALKPGGRVLILSDGFIDQRAEEPQEDPADISASSGVSSSSHVPEAGGEDDEALRFGIGGVERCLRSLRPGDDEITALFSALEGHAGTPAFDDDATAVIVRW